LLQDKHYILKLANPLKPNRFKGYPSIFPSLANPIAACP
jgi:hypothetical protein